MTEKLTQGKASSVHNPPLRDALRKVSQLSLELISREARPDDIPPKLRALHAVRPTPYTFGIEEIERPDWPALVRQYQNELKHLPAYSECWTLLKEDQVISRHLDRLVGTPYSRTILRAEEVIPSFVSTLLERVGACMHDDVIFDALYDELEQFFWSSTLCLRAIGPLLNLSGPDEVISLPDDVSIRRASDDEVDLWLQRADVMPLPAGRSTIVSVTHCIVRDFDMPKVCGEEEAKAARRRVPESTHSQTSRSFTDVLSCLRLLKSEYVDIPFTDFRIRGWCPPHVGAIRSQFANTPAPLFLGNRFQLSPEEVAVVSKLFELVAGFDRHKHGFLDIALRRFNLAAAEERAEDRLLDLVIALEAILLHGSDKEELRGEKRFRFSLNGAYLLSSERQERRRIFKQLREAYDCRSKVVHGGKLSTRISISGQKLSAQEFTGIIEARTRQVIRQVLALACKPNAPKQLVSWNDLVLGFPHTGSN